MTLTYLCVYIQSFAACTLECACLAYLFCRAICRVRVFVCLFVCSCKMCTCCVLSFSPVYSFRVRPVLFFFPSLHHCLLAEEETKYDTRFKDGKRLFRVAVVSRVTMD